MRKKFSGLLNGLCCQPESEVSEFIHELQLLQLHFLLIYYNKKSESDSRNLARLLNLYRIALCNNKSEIEAVHSNETVILRNGLVESLPLEYTFLYNLLNVLNPKI